MTEGVGPGGPQVPRTAAEWERVREAKHDVLSRDPFTVRPADHPGVRPEVVASWRRSLLAGVDPNATRFPVDDPFEPRTRLASVAQPIMNRLKDQISDLSSWGFLVDRGCRLLTAAVGDFPQAERVLRKDLRPGTCFAEDVIGTNGLGCAHELQQAFLISGTEHFRTDSEVLTTTGVVIRDPFTRRYVGTLGVHCRREYASAAVLPLVVEIGRSIEAQLLASRSDGEREFLDAFLAAQRRFRSPVVAVSRRLCVVSTRAREIVHEADEDLLRRIVAESGGAPSGRTVRRRLSSGATVTVRVLPVEQPRGEFAAVLVLEPVAADRPAPGPAAGPEPAPADLPTLLDRALGAGRPVLLTGEQGSGKRYRAREVLRAGAGNVVEVDGALALLAPETWLRRLRDAVQDQRAAVLLAHATEIPPSLTATVASLVAGARTPVVGTTADDGGEDGTVLAVRESFPVILTVPPLRDRRGEFPELCRSILADLAEADGRAVTLAPRALAALLAGDWPGNVRQLLQVLASARIRADGPEIGLHHLPARFRGGAPGRPLGEMERVERQALAAALRETGGNRNAVADRLGISRATVYRKLKRYELH
ncbi:sigma-54-dependent Fis family transcriptional regulator [Geodermatophilus ruber]|uniref:Transcriptional regulator of acetoin/glycerol metabolism n=1 Tax=Geodermatophilus ruber TaxID=504800 RepID=A0A1I4FB75_9ACTN|nr:helix-turn-helix domain-containing protein [Geodermatophilus ruber]SFL14723.1 Transcriptional regulator of acetoin/glycerol metabolism [Geodermatophilus ruber]